MSFGCKVGDTIFMLDSGGGHRYVVLTNPNEDGCVVVANFTSATSRISDGKIFTRNDDRNLFECPTIVHYRRVRILSVNKLKREAKRNDIVSDYKLCSPNIMEQIIKDAFKSQFIKGNVIKELRAHYPKEYEQYYENVQD